MLDGGSNPPSSTKRLEKATSQEVAFFIACVHVSEPALAACPGAVEGGMALMPPSAVAEGGSRVED